MDLAGIPPQRAGPVIHIIHRDEKNVRLRRRVSAVDKEKKKQGESDHWVSGSIEKQPFNSGVLIKDEKASSAPPTRQGKEIVLAPFLWD